MKRPYLKVQWCKQVAWLSLQDKISIPLKISPMQFCAVLLRLRSCWLELQMHATDGKWEPRRRSWGLERGYLHSWGRIWTQYSSQSKKERGGNEMNLQGDQNQNPLFQMAVPLKLCIFDPMFVKPKYVWRAVIFFFEKLKQTAENVNKFSKIEKKPTTSQTHYGFTNVRSEMHNFRGTAIWNNGFWFG